MTTNGISSWARAAAWALWGIWAGCAQGEGEPCQVDNDCEDGLQCDPRNTVRAGRCVRPEDVGGGGEGDDDGDGESMDAAVDSGLEGQEAGTGDGGSDV